MRDAILKQLQQQQGMQIRDTTSDCSPVDIITNIMNIYIESVMLVIYMYVSSF